MSSFAPDRRRQRRLPMSAGAKLYDPRTHRYHAAHTRDLSTAGVLLELTGPTALHTGQALRLAIDLASTGLLRQSEMTAVTVRRIFTTAAGRRFLAVQFAGRGRLSRAA